MEHMVKLTRPLRLMGTKRLHHKYHQHPLRYHFGAQKTKLMYHCYSVVVFKTKLQGSLKILIGLNKFKSIL